MLFLPFVTFTLGLLSLLFRAVCRQELFFTTTSCGDLADGPLQNSCWRKAPYPAKYAYTKITLKTKKF